MIVKTGGHSDQLSKRIDGIEKYRIMALEKFILNADSQPEYLDEALKIYLHKCNIYINGCKKRGKKMEIEDTKLRMRQIQSTYRHYSSHV